MTENMLENSNDYTIYVQHHKIMYLPATPYSLTSNCKSLFAFMPSTFARIGHILPLYDSGIPFLILSFTKIFFKQSGKNLVSYDPKSLKICN